VEAKRKRFAAWTNDPKRWATKVACDLYTAAFLLPKTGGAPANANSVMVPTTAHVRARLGGGSLYGPLEAAVIDAAEYARAFHWPLAFPEVMIARGGFDVVLGNPPWERIKLQEQEFFATRAPEIALAANAAARGRLIRKLADSEPGSPARQLFDQFELAKRIAEASSVFFTAPKDEDPTKMDLAKVGRARRYPWTGRGDVNTYALFAEHFLNLTSPTGQAGLIVPTGIATDATTAPFFGHLVSEKRLARMFDFENRAGLFPAVDSRMKFVLLTLGHNVEAADFAFFLTDPSQLDDPPRRFKLAPEQISRINPNTKTAPVFRAQADAELTAKIYARVPVLVEEGKGVAGNPWKFHVSTRLWHMAEDSAWFKTEAAPGLTPVYEAKMIHHFDDRWATYDETDSRDVSMTEKADPNFAITPRYWVPESEVANRLREKNWSRGWLMGWRDICRATDERTVIASVFPRSAVGHTSPLFFTDANPQLAAALVANLSAIALDYIARQKLGGTHLTLGYLQQLPVLPPSAYTQADLTFIVPRVLELSYTSHSLTPFARDLGYDGPPFMWDENRRAHLRADLDAWYALAYGLSREELRYVLDPRDVMGVDYPSESFRVLQKNEIAMYGEYRTARLVVAAYGRLVSEGMRPRTEGYR
jgi:hypothetical protein